MGWPHAEKQISSPSRRPPVRTAEPQEAARPRRGSISRAHRPTASVLLVDDSQAFLDAASSVLTHFTPLFTVLTATSGSEALALLEHEAPAFIILDFNLPDMNAPLVLERIMANPDWRDIPVLVLTQAAWDEDEKAALTAGARAYLAKPSRVQALHELVVTFWREQADTPISGSVLLVEDHPETARLIGDALRSTTEHFDVIAVGSSAEARARLTSARIDCVLLDYRLPDCDGLQCLEEIRTSQPDIPVIIITGAGSEEVAVAVMKCGATDYLVKHGRYLPRVPVVIRQALRRREPMHASPRYHPALRSTRREQDLPRRAQHERFQADGIIGESLAIRRALGLAARAAQSQATVLIDGESGTGKELFARAIHQQGPRARGPFLAVNCAALPEALLESELFGHERGAFTGADRTRRGLLEQAAGGTLFLDEVGEMSPAIQAKLLRVLQDGEIRPLGSALARTVDVRVIAATNRDLKQAIDAGRFRLDLYYRLRVFPLSIPTLRERPEDIALLAEHFLRQFCAQEHKALRGFSPEALRCLERYSWPGNVRELLNEVHRVVLCTDPEECVSPAFLSKGISGESTVTGADTRPLREIVRDVELATIQDRLRHNGYRRAATARSLGMTREGLWAKLRQLGVRLPPHRRDDDQ
jgi:DNA-binding NtrC family response regulator